jgi:short-subunit dehydrogenase
MLGRRKMPRRFVSPIGPSDRGTLVDGDKAVAELKSKGIEKVDVVIANAAINLSPGSSFLDSDVDEQMETLKVNVREPSQSSHD